MSLSVTIAGQQSLVVAPVGAAITVAITGNETSPSETFLQWLRVEFSAATPIFGVAPGYLDTLSGVDLFMNSCRAFYTITSEISLPIISFPDPSGYFTATYYSEQVYADAPVSTQQPTGNEKIVTVSDTGYDESTEDYFRATSGYGNWAGWTPLTVLSTSDTVAHLQGVGYFDFGSGFTEFQTVTVTLSNEYDYAGGITFAKDRVDTVDSTAFAALWTAGHRQDMTHFDQGAFKYPTFAYPGNETAPSNFYTGYSGSETISYGEISVLPASLALLTFARVQPTNYAGSGGGIVVDKGQLKYTGSAPLDYFLIETLYQGITGITWPSNPYVILSSGTMNNGDIIDIPYPSFAAPFVSHQGFGDVPVISMTVAFVVGTPGPIPGHDPAQWVEISAW